MLHPLAQMVVNKQGALQWDLNRNPLRLSDLIDWRGTTGVTEPWHATFELSLAVVRSPGNKVSKRLVDCLTNRDIRASVRGLVVDRARDSHVGATQGPGSIGNLGGHKKESPLMTTSSTLLRMAFGLSLLMISCTGAAGQSPIAGTETKVLPEASAHIELPSHLRVLAFSGLEQGVGYPYQQWYAAVAIGYQFKPILRPHPKNIDPDKEHYFLFGGGYEFLRTAESGKVTHEDRITIDITPSFRPTAKLLIRDRNWTEFRWIDGKYSTTYRNLLSVESDLLVHRLRLSPYGSVEAFYDGLRHSWDQEWYTAGIQWPYKRVFMLDTYYRREHCLTCSPENWNAGGVTLNFFLR